eukprot:g2435.t1
MPPKGGEISQSVEESNALRQKLGIKKLDESGSKSNKGTSNDPVHRPADKKVDPSDKDKDKESKRKAAAAKSKRADSSVPKMKVRHDSEAFKEGESVVMTLSDQRLIDKDGNLVETTLGREKGVGCDLGVGHLLF